MAKGAVIHLRAIDRRGSALELARARLEALEFHAWRRVVARVLTCWNARCRTCQLTEGEWLDHWRAGLDPASAVLEELHE